MDENKFSSRAPTNPTIAVVEDETDIRDMIHFVLSHEQFNIITITNGEEAMTLFAEHLPDLILLDWMLPGTSGIHLIRQIKKNEWMKNTPIIMLTSKAEEENKVKGLMAGADDYITKPFSPQELIARIKTVLRRGPLISPDNLIQYKALTLRLNCQEVYVESTKLNLTKTEYHLLLFFMKNPDKTYSRDRLITHVWGTTSYIDDRTVDACIKRLRNKLKPFGYHFMIETIRGSGYQFSKNKADTTRINNF